MMGARRIEEARARHGSGPPSMTARAIVGPSEHAEDGDRAAAMRGPHGAWSEPMGWVIPRRCPATVARMRLIDLRSDTVTRPTPAMREAMARADVGDDVYGEDPTINRLEAVTAEILGKEAALFVPTGTMGNQISLLVHTRRGDEVICGEDAHVVADESGAGAAWAGVQFRAAGKGGIFTAADLRAVVQEPDMHGPRQRLVALENPHNRAGGRVFPQAEVQAIAELARSRGLALHLDGARLWNVAAVTGISAAELAAPFDTVNVCYSKGLGAPVGSALAGSRALIAAARHYRKMLGGGMRQAGILGSGALYALEHHRARLVEDLAGAKEIEAALITASGSRAHVVPAETNQVNVDTPGVPAERLVEAARRRGVLVGAMAPFRTRAVVHLDVAPADIPVAARALAEALTEVLEGAR
ncbi:Low-specificity L-threonine aldolase [Minicystis rosea]|nr:Low-specificity L-threonine aldolase [Minicystis rosea]